MPAKTLSFISENFGKLRADNCQNVICWNNWMHALRHVIPSGVSARQNDWISETWILPRIQHQALDEQNTKCFIVQFGHSVKYPWNKCKAAWTFPKIPGMDSWSFVLALRPSHRSNKASCPCMSAAALAQCGLTSTWWRADNLVVQDGKGWKRTHCMLASNNSQWVKINRQSPVNINYGHKRKAMGGCKTSGVKVRMKWHQKKEDEKRNSLNFMIVRLIVTGPITNSDVMKIFPFSRHVSENPILYPLPFHSDCVLSLVKTSLPPPLRRARWRPS